MAQLSSCYTILLCCYWWHVQFNWAILTVKLGHNYSQNMGVKLLQKLYANVKW